jgi:hypothetical protein
MKYKAGDLVQVKSREWYENMRGSTFHVPPPEGGTVIFAVDMVGYCGRIFQVACIDSFCYDRCYLLDGTKTWLWEDWMLEDVVIENVKECLL